MEIKLNPIAYVQNSIHNVTDDHWGSVISVIELINGTETAWQGIEEFTHVEIIFYFHGVSDEKITYKARHPRNNKAFPEIGIFAQRGKNRPNKLGVTTVELVELSGKTITVKGLDAINGTPVLDVKPVMKKFLPRGEVKQPEWSVSLMKHYWE
ncbi:tRNA (N6-threonylcarbamoyladenosine(37)-N6)-methyltransferase TrmO [Bacillus atrophaeus]|uniref:SAM-dependent methyltransferase n=1 Tax=Bacillus atrophaeus TaxID=1452 RepID=UPI000D05E0FD|nr:SAM-dependent methyltransferase [Bacillus atrophaeus]PSA93905.1 tRNA (N6-threonylcarbamoyladenosine(37)-N6)-methyltransferase TrmO [Bacillus atrophaeus]